MAHVVGNCKTAELQAGMVVAKDIIFGNNVALSANVKLNDNLISSLRFLGIDEVAIYKDFDVPLYEGSQQRFFSGYSNVVNNLKKLLQEADYLKQLPIKEIREMSQAEIFPLIDASGAINHLQMIGEYDDYTFHHSINVSVVCGVFGRWLGYRQDELDELILAGLLHDIGKIEVPNKIINKKGPLTEEEMRIVRLHPQYGHKILQKSRSLSSDVLLGVLQHHERLDGSGYPQHLKAKQIHPYAKIIAIVDVYDALSTDRSYRRKINPFEVVDLIYSEMFDRLDPKLCIIFMNNVKEYYNENIVELSDGRKAEVVKMGRFLTSRPMVRTEDGEFIDLDQVKDLAIAKLIETI